MNRNVMCLLMILGNPRERVVRPPKGDNTQGENCHPIGTVGDEESRRMLVWLPMVEVK